MPFVIETSNVRPHADMQFFLLSCYEPTEVQTHLWLYNKERYVYSIPTGHSPLLGLLTYIRNFSRISERQNPSVVNAFLYVLLSRPFGVKTRTSRKSVTKLRKQIGITGMHRHKSTMNHRKCVLFCFKRLMSECRTTSDRLARKLKMRSKQRCNLKTEY